MTGNCTFLATVLLLIAAMGTHCTLSLPLCSEYSPQPAGELVTLEEGGTRCDRAAGILYYLWDVDFSGNLYRQIEIRCFTDNNPGAWEIVQPRTFSNVDGNKSYTIPAEFLEEVGITSCEIRGCYEEYGESTVYFTNSLLVTCGLPDIPASSRAMETTPARLPTPTTTSLELLPDEPTLATRLSMSSSPIAQPPRRDFPLQLIFIVPLVVLAGIAFLTICTTFGIICHRHRRKSNVLPFFEEIKFDVQKAPPSFGLITGELLTPYPSQFSLNGEPSATSDAILQTVTLKKGKGEGGVRSGGGSRESGEELSQISVPLPVKEREILGRDLSSSDENGQTDSVTTEPSSSGCVASAAESNGGAPVEISSVSVDESGTERSRVEGSQATEEAQFTKVDGNEMAGAGGNAITGGGGVEEGKPIEEAEVKGQNVDCFPAHFIFDVPSGSGSSSSGNTFHSSVQYQTSCSSGYVTDTSSLLSPLSLQGNHQDIAGNMKHEARLPGHRSETESLKTEQILQRQSDNSMCQLSESGSGITTAQFESTPLDVGESFGHSLGSPYYTEQGGQPDRFTSNHINNPTSFRASASEFESFGGGNPTMLTAVHLDSDVIPYSSTPTVDYLQSANEGYVHHCT